MILYTVPFSFSTGTAGALDIITLNPAAEKPIRIRGLRIGQGTGQSDANEKDLRLTIRRFTATVTAGTGGSVVTPVPVDDLDRAAGFSTRTGDVTTVATTSGTNELKEELGYWNVRSTPFEWWWPDERFAPHCRLAANRLLVRCETTPSVSYAVTGTLFVEEL